MKKVLIVEDDPFIRDISSLKLAGHGYEVVSVADGASAIEALAEHQFNAVLLDLDLPDISGAVVLTKIRESEKLKHLPVIVFSNRDDEQHKTEVEQLGISGYFIKASTEFSEIFALLDTLAT